MAKVKIPASSEQPKRKPASSPEARENQMIAMAYNLVEERLRNGTATSQETTFFLRLGSTKERLEKEKLEIEKELLAAKTKSIESQEELTKIYSEAITAMKEYQGGGPSQNAEELS